MSWHYINIMLNCDLAKNGTDFTSPGSVIGSTLFNVLKVIFPLSAKLFTMQFLKQQDIRFP